MVENRCIQNITNYFDNIFFITSPLFTEITNTSENIYLFFYSSFFVGDLQSNYSLTIGGYSGNAGAN